MTAITRIELSIQTGGADGAGMQNGEVYLGLAGREFHVDSAHNDFEPDSDFTYIFSHHGANVTDQEDNDPTDPWQLDSDDIKRCPRYIRFEPRRVAGRVEEWNVASVQLVVKSGNSVIFTEKRLGEDDANLWMGGEFKSRYLYFP